jgi:hypothetical protein
MIKESTMKMFIAAALSALAAAAAPGVAQAEFGITSFGGAASLDGEFSRQAGAHADLTTLLRFPTVGSVADGEVKTIKVDLPPGVTGDPTAAPTCSSDGIIAGANARGSVCPIGSQVGLATVYNSADLSAPGMELPVYNMEHPADLPGLFAFNYDGAVLKIEPRVRSTDYGISATVPSISQAARVFGSRLTLWGVPADRSHDPDRFIGDTTQFLRGCGDPSVDPNCDSPKSPAPRLPFMTNPTSCDGKPAVTKAQADSWQNPGVFSTASFDSDFDGTPFITTGCERLPFDPSITVQPGSHLADAPTGLTVDVTVPQSDDPAGLATAHVRKTVVTLPSGMSVSPSSAAGLGACAPGQIKLGLDDAPTCPDSSKIGTVTIDTPLLSDPLEGDVILATQDDNPFHSLLALYLVARGPGVTIKLPGRVDPDPVTGQLTATFDNTPQLPFSKLHVVFRGGAKAPLATPTACGRYNTHAEITSWASDTPVKLDTPMVIDEGCAPREFAASFSAGTRTAAAGVDAPFTFALTRADRTQYLSRIDAVLPPGLLAKIASVPQCPEDLAATGGCARGTEIGSTSVLSGPGETPLPLTGRVYLTGPYGGAPFGLSIVVPTAGQAGPFDLGNVIVRAAIFVDRTDAHVTVKSDPLPTIIRGIPLRMRQVIVNMDRPGFMFNPTSCSQQSIAGSFGSLDGAALTLQAPFQAIGCRDLPVSQQLAIKLTGKKATTDGTHPGVSATLTSPSGASNLKKVTVTLPLSLALEPENARALCKPLERMALNCPKESIVGHATAQSILPHPLTGPVYFVEGTRRSPNGRVISTLPKLWIPLSADGVIVDLDADSNVDELKRLVTTFRNIPDAPISSFKLELDGGAHGILAVSGKPSACDRPLTADTQLVGQNGVTEERADDVSFEGCKPHIAKSSYTSKAVTLRLNSLGAGRLTVSGSGVARASRTLKAATAATITARLTKKARTALHRHRSVRVKLSVSFKPKSGHTTKVAKSILVRR